MTATDMPVREMTYRLRRVFFVRCVRDTYGFEFESIDFPCEKYLWFRIRNLTNLKVLTSRVRDTYGFEFET